MKVAFLSALFFGLVPSTLAGYDCSGQYPSLVPTLEYGGMCYAFVISHRNERDYDDARRTCQTYHGTIALVKSAAINNALAVALKRNVKTTERYWIGLSDKRREGVFEWVDGTRAYYTHFADGHGTSRRNLENCVVMDYSGYWFEDYCVTHNHTIPTMNGDINLQHNGKKHFICQFQPVKAWNNRNCAGKFPLSVPTMEFGGICYAFSATHNNFYVRDYNDAERWCEKYGESLALVKTQAINNALAHALSHHLGTNERFWIGLNDKHLEGVYQWEDKTWAVFTNFAAGFGLTAFIVRHVEDCVAMAYTGYWYDYGCMSHYDIYSFRNKLHSAKRHFICQFKSPAYTTTASTQTPQTSPRFTTPTTQAKITTKQTTEKPTTKQTRQTTQPTKAPTTKPTTQPTKAPTTKPTTQPTKTPTTKPTTQPTKAPTTEPTTQPTKAPTTKPTTQPTKAPTTKPTTQPTKAPTTEPTTQPTKAPTTKPITQPTKALTSTPTKPTTNKRVSITTRAPVTCPIFTCEKECGLLGFQVDSRTGCFICACEEEEEEEEEV